MESSGIVRAVNANMPYSITVSGIGDTGYMWFSGSRPRNCKPKRIVFIDNKTTKCTFEDGTEIFVTVKENDIFNEEVGVALCVAHYLYRDEPKGKKKFLRAIKRLAERPNSKVVKKNEKVKINQS